MKKFGLTAVLLYICALLPLMGYSPRAAGAEYIIIDGRTAEKEGNRTFGGFTAVLSDGNSSLLRDYKKNNPREYYEILHILFDKQTGVCLTGIDIEMGNGGGDAAGAEMPALLSEGDTPDLSASFSWEFASDALHVNPDLKISLFGKTDPAFVKSAFEISTEAGYNARYRRFKAYIEEAYKKYGISLYAVYPDCTGADSPDTKWIIAFSERLKGDEKALYNYNRIRIAVSDESAGLIIADKMLADPSLLNTVNIISCAEIPENAEKAKNLAKKYGKEFIFAGGNVGKDPLAFANSVIRSYARGKMTSYALLPAVFAGFDSAKYYPDGLICVSSPWSGYYKVTETFTAAEHFTRFCGQNSRFVESASATGSCVVLTNPETDDFTIITANDSSSPKEYVFSVSYLKSFKKNLKVYVSDFSDGNYLMKCSELKPEISGDVSLYKFTAPPYSAASLTTSDFFAEYDNFCSKGESRLALPYSESFDDGIADYFTPYSGLFKAENGKLIQKITLRSAISENLFPCASFGDGTWADYSVSADVFPEGSSESFAGISIRYNASFGKNLLSGYSLIVYGNGKWELLKDSDTISSGKMPMGEHNLKISAQGRVISAYIDEKEVFTFEDGENFIRSGRVSVISSYHRNAFDNLNVLPLGDTPYIDLTDAVQSDCLSFSEGFSVSYPSYTYYERSVLSQDDTESFVIGGTERAQLADCFFSGISHAEEEYSARIIFHSQTLFVNGDFPENSEITLDGKTLESGISENGIILSGLSENNVHTLFISSQDEMRIDLITNGYYKKDSRVITYSYTGGGFSLIGENSESSLADIYFDGELIAENTVTDNVPPRKCFFAYETDSFGKHEITIKVKAGQFSLDAVGTDTNDLVKSESSREPMILPESALMPSGGTETSDTEYIETENAEAAAQTQIKITEEKPNGKNLISAFITALAAGTLVFFISAKKHR